MRLMTWTNVLAQRRVGGKEGVLRLEGECRWMVGKAGWAGRCVNRSRVGLRGWGARDEGRKARREGRRK